MNRVKDPPGEFSGTLTVLYYCAEVIDPKTTKEKHEWVYDRLEVFFKGKHAKSGRLKFNYQIGRKDSEIYVTGICWRAFCLAYKISHRTFKHYKSDFNNYHISRKEQDLNDRYSCSLNSIAAVKDAFATFGLDMDHSDLAQVLIPNTHEALIAYTWMAEFFALAGDSMPNAAGEIHLDFEFKNAY